MKLMSRGEVGDVGTGVAQMGLSDAAQAHLPGDAPRESRVGGWVDNCTGDPATGQQPRRGDGPRETALRALRTGSAAAGGPTKSKYRVM